MSDEQHSKATLRPCDCTCICGDDRDVERGIAEPCESRKASAALTAKAVERSERVAALIKAGGYKPGFDFLDALEALSSSQAALAECSAVKDGAYLERNQVVAALAKCYPSGIALTPIEGWSPEWFGCVYIDLPTGQASWHFHTSHTHLFADLPPYTGKWDGHSTPEKYERLANLPIVLMPTGLESRLTHLLVDVQNGLNWYQGLLPETASQTDDEIHAEIDACIAALAIL